ncbi:MAG: adenine deaminase [Oscillospiraceae bacterium]|nr:adenine deaminase [Oscillospiraceae bacterium]
MKILLKGGNVVNVFTGEVEQADVVISDGKIIGVGAYADETADITEDISGKFVCPGFIDGHIHIESTMLTPAELTKLCMPHGTTAIVADPHEIANVCGTAGIRYMLQASKGLPMTVYFNLPSCVPATPLDESGAVLNAEDIEEFYNEDAVVGLAEMMNFPGVLADDPQVLKKISDAVKHKKIVDGHAPFLTGKALDKYIAAGVQSDHECTNVQEAVEKIRKGQWVMIRQGTAARNLEQLLPLFDAPYNHRCVLVTDDRHPADLVNEGHIDNIIRLAAANGKSAITAIQMATIQAAQCFGLRYVGAVAPGYKADILVLNDLNSVDVCDVYSGGVKVVSNKVMSAFETPAVSDELREIVFNSFHTEKLTHSDFILEAKTPKCRVIKLIPGQLVTDEAITDINWENSNGIDLDRDILKLAVIERHKNTGHKGIGFINGIGLKKGAIASSVSHDSHNIIVIGTNEEDMAAAANHICSTGGNVIAVDGEIVCEMPLPVAGLMTELSGAEISVLNEKVRKAVYDLGVPENIEPFMNMAFVSLPVIPSLKMTTFGLVDVNKQEIVSLYCD